MTVERASEMVSSLRKIDQRKAANLYQFFIHFFGIQNTDTFGRLCGYPVI